MKVANEILAHLGGSKFVVMTGSKNFAGDDNSLRMNLTRNKVSARFLKITLNSMDTYDLEFFGMSRKGDKLVKATRDGIYCDQLQAVFTEVTGLYTSL